MVSVWFCAFSRCVGTFIFPLQLATDLLHPSADDERRKHKLKRLVQSPNSYFMDVKCPGVCNCVEISLVCDGALALLVCYDVSHICKLPYGLIIGKVPLCGHIRVETLTIGGLFSRSMFLGQPLPAAEWWCTTFPSHVLYGVLEPLPMICLLTIKPSKSVYARRS